MKVSGKLFLLQLILYAHPNGTPNQVQKTIVRYSYDNDAVYIAVLLYDDEPNKIMKKSRLEMILSFGCF
jgi:hypothetical protein